MGMRDFIAHHYFDIDHEVIFSVCHNQIPKMASLLSGILGDLRK